ncbi:MAG: phasin family protein [Burkholderiaceae bacterium]|nr:phasin family protein [Burkholderiaceae bacterium]MDO9088986.1 phasin family protein [Burkholderiaceae bacterium]
MAKKPQKQSADKKSGSQLSDTVKESAHQIWLAGLGAFAKAQQEGGKVFESLVREGSSLQRKTQAVAEEKMSEASDKMSSMATDLTAKASGQWNKLETLFEERVSRSLKKLGVPTTAEVAALTARIDELNRTVSRLTPKPTAKPRPVVRAASSPAPAAKRTAKPATGTAKPRAKRRAG